MQQIVRFNELYIEKNSLFYDIKTQFQGTKIIESIKSHWPMAYMNLISQYNLDSELPIEGNEKFHISFGFVDDVESSTDFEMMLNKISDIYSNRETISDNIDDIQMVEKTYSKIINKKPYFKHFYQQNNALIITEIMANYGITVVIDPSVDIITPHDYIASNYNIMQTIEDVLVLSSDPLCMYQKDGVMYLNSFANLFNQEESYMINNASLTSLTEENNRSAVKDIRRKNIIDVSDANRNNHSGYIHFKMDLFANTYEKIDRTNSTTKEDTSEMELKNVLTKEKYFNKVSVLANKSIVVNMVIPSTKIKLGDKVSFDMNSMIGEQLQTLKLSGDYIVHTIIHDISINMTYEQSIILIKK